MLLRDVHGPVAWALVLREMPMAVEPGDGATAACCYLRSMVLLLDKAVLTPMPILCLFWQLQDCSSDNKN